MNPAIVFFIASLADILVGVISWRFALRMLRRDWTDECPYCFERPSLLAFHFHGLFITDIRKFGRLTIKWLRTEPDVRMVGMLFRVLVASQAVCVIFWLLCIWYSAHPTRW
jgi:hypothetical protein